MSGAPGISERLKIKARLTGQRGVGFRRLVERGPLYEKGSRVFLTHKYLETLNLSQVMVDSRT